MILKLRSTLFYLYWTVEKHYIFKYITLKVWLLIDYLE